MLTNEQLARFWSKVDKRSEDECWEWRGSMFPDGYGQFSIQHYPYVAHRVIFQHFLGRKLERWELVCHHCDNRRCVNYVKHLFLGSNSDNMLDCSRKGRMPTKRGRDSNFAKLTEEQVVQIRSYAGRAPQLEVAQQFGISKALVSLIWAAKVWPHLGPVPGYSPVKIATKTTQRRRLTEEDVRNIRKLHAAGITQAEIVKIFGITSASACMIVNRQQWKHVK